MTRKKEKPPTKRQQARIDREVDRMLSEDRLLDGPIESLLNMLLLQLGSRCRIHYRSGAAVIIYKGPGVGALLSLAEAHAENNAIRSRSGRGNIRPAPLALDGALKKLVKDCLSREARRPGDWHEGKVYRFRNKSTERETLSTALAGMTS